MSRNPLEHRDRPCRRCPWRTDADPAAFTDRDMDKLSAANGTPDNPAGLNAPTMSCHLDQPGTAHPMRLCAGWLAVVGPHHWAIRLKVAAGRLPARTLAAAPGWPALHKHLGELLSARARATRQQAETPAG